MTGFIQTLVNGLLLGGVYALAASGLTLVFGVMNVINVGLFLVLTKTWVGRAIRASAQNPEVARLVGIDVKAVAAFAFALGAATTGAGGSLISVLYPFLPASHYQWISRLLGVIVLGGMGSLGGAFAGALLMGLGESLTTAYIGPRWQTVVPYVVIFVVLLVRPQGLLGTRTREDV